MGLSVLIKETWYKTVLGRAGLPDDIGPRHCHIGQEQTIFEPI
jgi:hypothetical protein